MPQNSPYDYIPQQVFILSSSGDPAELVASVKDIQIPSIELATDTDLRIGQGGEVHRPMNTSAITTDMTLIGVPPLFEDTINASFRKEVTLMIVLDGINANDGSDRIKRTDIITGIVTKFLGADLTAGEKAEWKLTLGVNEREWRIGDGKSWLYRPKARFFGEKGGTNLWA